MYVCVGIYFPWFPPQSNVLSMEIAMYIHVKYGVFVHTEVEQ